MDGLVHPPSLGDEPEVDRAESPKISPGDAGLLGDLADGRLLGGLAGLDVTLGQRPEQPTPAVCAPDQRAPGIAVSEVDDQAARAGLVDSLQAGRRRVRPPPDEPAVSRPDAGASALETGRAGARPRRLGTWPDRNRRWVRWPSVTARGPADLVPVPPVAAAARRGCSPRPGYQLHLVGGPVRDALLGAARSADSGSRLHHRRPPRRRCSSWSARWPRRPGRPESSSAPSARWSTGNDARSRPSARIATTGCPATRRSRSGRHSRTTCAAATSR